MILLVGVLSEDGLVHPEQTQLTWMSNQVRINATSLKRSEHTSTETDTVYIHIMNRSQNQTG
jgi:hypothetical protein